MRFIQNILHLLQCRPPSASGNHRLSWSESPKWFLSMPSLVLFSTIPSSGVASSMLFLRESTRWNSREGSSPVNSEAIRRLFYSLPYSWFIYAKKSPNFSFSSSAFMHSNNSCSEFLHSCCKNKFYIKIRYYNCKKQKSLSADVSLVTLYSSKSHS